MTDFSKATDSTYISRTSGQVWFRHAKAAVLLAITIFAFLWQNIHYQAKFHLHVDDLHSDASQLTNFPDESDAPKFSTYQSHHHGECLICQFQRQFSRIHVLYAPQVVFAPEIKSHSEAIFFNEKDYRSTENSPTGGRAPPLS